MHEAKIASLILEKARTKVSLYPDASKVRVIELAIGKFRNVDIESLLFAFDSLKTDYSELSQSKLEIDEIEIKAQCQKNGHDYTVELFKNVSCPQCGSGIGALLSGQELEIRKIQLEAQALNHA